MTKRFCDLNPGNVLYLNLDFYIFNSEGYWAFGYAQNGRFDKMEYKTFLPPVGDYSVSFLPLELV